MQKVEGSSPFSRSSSKPCNSQGFFVSGACFEGVRELGRTNRADQSASRRARIRTIHASAWGSDVRAAGNDQAMVPLIAAILGAVVTAMLIAVADVRRHDQQIRERDH